MGPRWPGRRGPGHVPAPRQWDLRPWPRQGRSRELRTSPPEGVPAMAVASEIRDHHTLCVPHLARLQVLATFQAGEPVPPGLADDVGAVTSAILAEADAALRATVAAVPGIRRTAVAEFLGNRVT